MAFTRDTNSVVGLWDDPGWEFSGAEFTVLEDGFLRIDLTNGQDAELNYIPTGPFTTGHQKLWLQLFPIDTDIRVDLGEFGSNNDRKYISGFGERTAGERRLYYDRTSRGLLAQNHSGHYFTMIMQGSGTVLFSPPWVGGASHHGTDDGTNIPYYYDGEPDPDGPAMPEPEPEPEPVTPAAPTMADNVVTVPTLEGVIYSPSPGTYTLDADTPQLEVTAAAAEGYTLEGTAAWTFDYTAPEPEPEPEPEEPVGTNQLWEEWPGDNWTITGNGQTGPDSVYIRFSRAAAFLDEDGLLNVPVNAESRCQILIGAEFDSGFGTTLGRLSNTQNQEYGARIAWSVDVVSSASVSVYTSTANMYGIIDGYRAGTESVEDVEPDTVTDAAAVGNSPATGERGYAQLSVTAATDGVVKVAVPFYGAADDVPESIEWPTADEPDDPSPGDGDELAAELAPRVAAYVGKAGNDRLTAQIEAQLPIVIEFVRGYTRGHGFNDGQPVAALKACIISAASRLATNPEQVHQYQQADYSERPALLTGFTLIERRTLNNYRRVTA